MHLEKVGPLFLLAKLPPYIYIYIYTDIPTFLPFFLGGGLGFGGWFFAVFEVCIYILKKNAYFCSIVAVPKSCLLFCQAQIHRIVPQSFDATAVATNAKLSGSKLAGKKTLGLG